MAFESLTGVVGGYGHVDIPGPVVHEKDDLRRSETAAWQSSNHSTAGKTRPVPVCIADM